MKNALLIILLVYLIVISCVAVYMTIKDKNIAKKNEPLVKKYGKTSKKLTRRVPERTLMWIAAAGGSIAMLITMKKIRHKTQHNKFMIGIPAIIFAQAVLIALCVYFSVRA